MKAEDKYRLEVRAKNKIAKDLLKKLKAEPRKGDWICPKCKANVFASRANCFKCDTPNPNPTDSVGVCFNYQKGSCEFGDECRFRHASVDGGDGVDGVDEESSGKEYVEHDEERKK